MRSPDANVLTLLDLASSCNLGAQTLLQYITGKGTKNCEIGMVERVQMIGPNKM